MYRRNLLKYLISLAIFAATFAAAPAFAQTTAQELQEAKALAAKCAALKATLASLLQSQAEAASHPNGPKQPSNPGIPTNPIGEEIQITQQQIILTCKPNIPPHPAPPPMTLTGLEVIQAIQDLKQDVPLIAGKTTWVRAFFTSDISSNATVKATLKATNTTNGATVSIPSSNTVTFTPGQNANRNSWSQSVNFALPANIIAAGNVNLSISEVDQVPSASLTCGGCSNNQAVTFVTAPPVRLKIIGLRYSWGSPAAVIAPRAIDFTMTTSWVGRAYPTAQVISSQTTINGVSDFVPGPNFTCNTANAQISAIRANEVANGVAPSTHYIALVEVVSNDGTAATYMRGCANAVPTTPTPSTVASAPTGLPSGLTPVNEAGDNSPSFGGWYSGHELGHTFGRAHPGFCNGNSQSDPSFPNPNGQISDNAGTYEGLDTGDSANGIPLTLLPGESHFEIMTYCNQQQWLSAYTYEGILARLKAENPTLPISGTHINPIQFLPLALKPGAFVHVVALVNLTKGTGKIRFVTPVSAAEDQPEASATGDLIALSSTGQVLASYPVVLREDSDAEAGKDLNALVDASIPFTPNLAKIELVVAGKVVDTFSASQNTPASPARPRVTPPGRPTDLHVLAWDVTPPPEPTTYTVETSHDGKTWETIAVGVSEPSLALSPEQAASEYTRITATNGFKNSAPVIHTPTGN